MEKLRGNYNEWTVTQTLLGKILDISQQRVNQLIEEEIVVRDESSKGGAVMLIESMRNYYQSKQSYSDDAGKQSSFWKEHTLHERAKRQLAELKLRQQSGELYEAEVVERVIIEELTMFRNNLLGLPNKLTPILAGKGKAAIHQILTEEIEQHLTDLSRGLENAEFSELPAAEGSDTGSGKTDNQHEREAVGE